MTPKLTEIRTEGCNDGQAAHPVIGQRDCVTEYDYDDIPEETRTQAQQAADQVRALLRRAAEDLVQIGTKLLEVKRLIGHGKFGGWIEAEFGWSHSTANRFMRVAETFKFVNVTNFAPSAMYLLAAPSTPPEAVTASVERAEAGETITTGIAKVIIHTFKPRRNEGASVEQIEPPRIEEGSLPSPSSLVADSILALEEEPRCTPPLAGQNEVEVSTAAPKSGSRKGKAKGVGSRAGRPRRPLLTTAEEVEAIAVSVDPDLLLATVAACLKLATESAEKLVESSDHFFFEEVKEMARNAYDRLQSILASVQPDEH